VLAHEAPAAYRTGRRQHHAITRRPQTPAAVLAIGLCGALVWGLSALGGGSAGDAAPSAAPAASEPAAAAQPVPVTTAPAANAALAVDTEGCQLDVRAVQVGDTGEAVECVQKALTVAGVYAGPIDGQFSAEVEAAALRFQSDNGLYVDGIVGRRTGELLGIWPGDESFVVRTPPPAPGTYDAMGYELSSVASTGDDAPPLPDDAGQGTGKRVVYSRLHQRVWAIDADENIVRSYLVSGSQYNNETPGVYSVYSKSEMATGWNFEADLPYMVRYLQTDRGHIGFHQIPINKASGEVYQTEDELGQRLSGGCQRQTPLDAIFMWNFADVGTTVIVL
jgi:peptidoglycan hydrolase-like protein with peptidoglycan-binding domain